jgi:hypothetical protein
MKKAKVLYTIYDDSGNVYAENLPIKKVINEVNELLSSSESDDGECEKIKTLKDAKDELLLIDFKVKRNPKMKSKDVEIYDVSNDYENEFNEGGKIDKNLEIITKKIGFNESNARYIIEQSPKFAIWIADSILKEQMSEIKAGYVVDIELGKNVEIPKEPVLKKMALEYINERRGFEVRSAYGGGIRIILDWLKHPLTPKQNLRELSFMEAVDKAKIFHEELKVLGGDVDYKEPEENIIIKEYDEQGDIKYYWVLIPKSFCDVESGRMGHCGRTSSGNELISLRSQKKYGKDHTITDSHVTIAYGVEDGLFYQTKGKKNQKPNDKYKPYIFDLIKHLSSDKFYIYHNRNKLTYFSVAYRTSGMDAGKYFIYEGAEEIKNQNGNIKYFETESDAYGYIDEIADSQNSQKYIYTFNGFDSDYDSKEDYGFEDMTKEEVNELYQIKPEIFSDFGGQILLYDLDIIEERPSTNFIYEADIKYAVDLITKDRQDEKFVLSIISGDYFDYYDSYSYYYEASNNYIDDLNKENEMRVFNEISRITGHSIDEIKEKKIKHYLNRKNNNFSKNNFDSIKRSIASALNRAYESNWYNYFYGRIKYAFEKLGVVHKLDDSGVKIEIDLSNQLSTTQISAYAKEYGNNLESIFFEAIDKGDIEIEKFSYDERYQAYPDNKDFNEAFADIDLSEGYEDGGSINKKKKIRKVMREFKKGKLTSHGKKVTDRNQAIAIALSYAKKMREGGNIKDNLEVIDEIKEFVSSHATITDSYVYNNTFVINFEDSIPYFFDLLPKYLESNFKIGAIFDLDLSVYNDNSLVFAFRKENKKGIWYKNLSMKEKMLVLSIAKKFMDIETDCMSDDCMKKIDRTQLEKELIMNEKQMTDDAKKLAYSILNKI